MKINVIKSGKFAESGIIIRDMAKGEQDVNKAFAGELIDAGWATPYEEKKEIAPVTIESEQKEFDREAAEEEYRELGGRPRDDWSDSELIDRIEQKRAE